MLRDPLLNTKRTELQKCVVSRKRKLAELYNVSATVNATVQTSATSQDTTSASKLTETQFQDTNDILKQRAFDLSSLLRIPQLFAQHFVSTSQTSHGQGSNHATTGIRTPAKGRQSVPGTTQNGNGVEVGNSKSKVTDNVDTHGALDNAGESMEGVVSHGQQDEDTSVQVDQKQSRLPQPSEGGEPTRRSLGTEEGKNVVTVDSDEASQAQQGSNNFSRDLGLAASGGGLAEAASTPDAQLRQEAAQFSGIQDSIESTKARKDSGITDTDVQTPIAVRTTPNGASDSTIASRRRATSQDQRLPGMTSSTSRDVMLGQKQPMRIDTTMGRPQPVHDSATPGTAFTPVKSGMQSSPPERMTTRVSSGVLRHKSVSEILGETPKTGPSHGEKTPLDSARGEHPVLSRRESLVASPESASLKSRFGDREKDRSKPSTVVFARPSTADRVRNGEGMTGLSGRRIKSEEDKDYLVPLFAAQAEAQKPALDELIKNAHKTLDTTNWYIHHHETQDCRILKRIYHLQNSNRWSFRQIERSAEPPRSTTHWDHVLNELKWMRTDFREERKWKVAAARNLAEACAEWVKSPEELRSTLQIKVQKSTAKVSAEEKDRTTPVSTPNATDIKSDGTPELIPSAEDDLSDALEDLPPIDVTKATAPAALFSLAPEDVLFSLDKTPASDKLLAELPLYQPFEDPRGTNRTSSEVLDSAWQRPLVPVSKYTLGKLVANNDGPPRKRSRYDYAEEDEAEVDLAGDTLLPLDRKNAIFPPEKADVALFEGKNKHIIARLHAAHAFRPPSEFPMPSQQFFEARNPSQWTLAEDDELRRLVREYEYNWSLISASLSSPSMFHSAAERRTPWECFERWESFEGLPGDMDKHSYFRAWKSRRQNAKQLLEQKFNEAQSVGATGPLRRRSGEPVHVERRRSTKHLALIHAMSKVAKKKETALQKQQHAASMAAMRKASETSQRKLIMQTPKQFSDHKHKQEQEFKEKQALYRQQVLANQRAIMSQKAAQQPGQQPGASTSQQGRVPIPGQMNGASPRMASSLPQGATQAGGRPLPPSQAMLNGMVTNMRPGTQIPAAQMQAYLQSQQQGMRVQGIPDNRQQIMAAASIAEQQQRLVQQRQFQSQGSGSNPIGPNGTPNVQMQANPDMHGNMQSNGKVNGQSQSMHQRNSSSPLMSGAGQAQPLSSGMVPLLNQFTSQIRAQHPSLTQDQVKQLATMNLNQHLRAQNSQAGGVNMNSNNGQIGQQGMGINPMNPALYAQIMRSQQANQQHRNGGEANGQRPESRGATPKQGSQQPNGASQSPHQHQAQVAGT